MKIYRAALFSFFLMLYSAGSFALPVLFDLTVIEDSPGNDRYSGVFTVDSADISALPSTGLSFNALVTSIEINIAGILFDTTPNDARAPANDGMITGILNAARNGFTSSANPGLTLFFRTSGGSPFDWVVNDNNGIVRSGSGTESYSVIQLTSVPVPAAIWLLGSGLIGLVGLRRRQGGS